jgi:nucleotide-binding universal stress UspA family protein
MYSQILVPVDGSTASICGLKEAISIAAEHGSKLRLLHVVRTPALDYGYDSGSCKQDVIASLCQSGKEILNAAEIVARDGGLAPECVLIEATGGTAADVILDQATQWPASLIVMGTHPRDGRTRVGSDTAEVLAKAPVPVLLLRSAAPPIAAVHRPLEYVSVA